MTDNETIWTEDEYEYTWTCSGCGGCWVFEDQPTDNDFNYCPKCGRRIVEFMPRKEASDE